MLFNLYNKIIFLLFDILSFCVSKLEDIGKIKEKHEPLFISEESTQITPFINFINSLHINNPRPFLFVLFEYLKNNSKIVKCMS